jgi:hypothetical protein
MVTIPIENYGHTRVSNFIVELYFSRLRIRDMKKLELRKLEIKQSSPIRPGPSRFSLAATLPTESSTAFTELLTGMQIWGIAGTIQYDTGFGKMDSVIICAQRAPQNAKWTNCGGMSVDANFNKAEETKQ